MTFQIAALALLVALVFVAILLCVHLSPAVFQMIGRRFRRYQLECAWITGKPFETRLPPKFPRSYANCMRSNSTKKEKHRYERT